MTVTYDEKHDLLYISLDDGPKQVTNVPVDDGIVLDFDEDDRIVGIEILDASRRVKLDQLMTLEHRKTG